MAVWVTTTGSYIPEGAIRAGYEADGRPLFVARATIEGIVTPGKAGYHLPGGHFPYGMKEQIINQYEILVHPQNSPGFYEWKKSSHGQVPPNAFMTDRDTYIGRMHLGGGLVPGKIATGSPHRCAYASYAGKEHNSKEYEVLCRTI